MEKLKKVISENVRWTDLKLYTDRIEAFLENDFSQALENVKALLESIGKEICASKGITLDSTSSVNAVLKKAFSEIGYSTDSMVNQISSSLATIGQQVGQLRNEIGATSHGRSLEELRDRNKKVDELTREFLIDSTVVVACFLIRSFETENPRVNLPVEKTIHYEENESFNDSWDETYGDFEMGEYSYPASEILFNVDYPAYVAERKAFVESGEGDE